MPFVTKTLAELNITSIAGGKSAQSLCKSCRLECRYHAEMQILMQIEKDYQLDESNKIYPYIGISKKTCFLCTEVLNLFPFYRTRGSHGKVYGLWDIPPIAGLGLQFVIHLQAALLDVQRRLEELVTEAYHASLKNKLAFVAESSAGVSSDISASIIHRRLRHQGRVEQRLRNDDDEHQHQSRADATPYGEVLRYITAAKLPGDGDRLRLLKIPIVATPTYYKGFDNYSTRTPNFRDYWGWLDFGKCVVSIDAEDQEIKSTNGR